MRPILQIALFAVGLVALAAPAVASPATTVAEAGFAAGPGKDYDISRTLAVGSHVDVIWCGTHQNWCLIEIHNKRGWVPLASLTFKQSRAVNVDGTTSGGGTAPTATAPGGTPVGSQPDAMATKANDNGGGGGIKFSPVNNYGVVKSH